MTCKDLVTANPKCCLPEDSISRAAQIMREEDVGPIPVVSDHANRKVIGIVTDRDIAVKIVAAGWDPQAVYVGEVMLFADPVMCRVDDDYTKALQRMASQQVRRILVVNEDGSLAGIISQADIARRASEEEVGEVVEEISEPVGFGHPLRSLGPDYSRHRYEEGAGFDANSLVMSAACLTVGAGIMFLLDPARGRARRARLRDKAASVYNDSTDYAAKVQRDLRNRATGAVASAKSRLRRAEEEEVSDQKLEARVRSTLGRSTSHPHAISVRAKNGCITLGGNILAHETSNVLSSVRSVSGVQDIENRLRVHEDAGNLSALQGGNARARQRWDFMQSNWSPATRLVASAIGGGLVLYGLATVGDELLTRGNKEVTAWDDMTVSQVSVELYGGSS